MKIRVVALALSSFIFETGFITGLITYDPMDVVQNTITAKNSVQALINQGKQLEYELKNIKNLSGSYHNDAAAILDQISACSQVNTSFGYYLTNLEKEFQKKFPGFSEDENYAQQNIERTNSVRDTLLGTLKGLAAQAQSITQEKNSISELGKLSSNSNGNLEAQQVSHRIALEQITQIQKLRQLLINQASSEQAYHAYQLQQDQTAHNQFNKWIINSQTSFKRYDDRNGFGPYNLPSLP